MQSNKNGSPEPRTPARRFLVQSHLTSLNAVKSCRHIEFMNHADKDLQCSRIVNKLEFVAAVLQSMQLAEVLPDIRAGPIDGRALAEVVHIAERERNRFEVVVRIADAFDIAIADIGLERAAEGGDVSTDRRRIAVHEERARHIVGQHTVLNELSIYTQICLNI